MAASESDSSSVGLLWLCSELVDVLLNDDVTYVLLVDVACNRSRNGCTAGVSCCRCTDSCTSLEQAHRCSQPLHCPYVLCMYLLYVVFVSSQRRTCVIVCLRLFTGWFPFMSSIPQCQTTEVSRFS